MSGSSELIGRVGASRYRIVATLGRGATARVYLADDIQLKRPVAVKVLRESLADDVALAKRFRAEALAVARLNSPHIVHIYDSGPTDDETGLPFLVCEYLDGGSLQSMLEAGHRLTVPQALLVGRDAARGLRDAHAANFVHRDIKPANILFGRDGRLRIADFGLARALAESSWSEPEGIFRGTPGYASPEQAGGERVDARSDIYSLGLVLAEAVTGLVPFAASTRDATLDARRVGDLGVIEELGRLAPIVESCCRREPADRPTAVEVEAALSLAVRDQDTPSALPLVPLVPREIVVDPSLAETEQSGSPPTEVIDVTGSRSEPASAIDQDDSDVGDDPPLGGDTRDTARRRRTRRVLIGVLVVVLVGVGGLISWRQLRTPSHVVPTLVGLQRDEAARQIRSHHWKADTSKFERRDGTRPGQVLSQRPAAGTELVEGSTVRLVVSLGYTMVELPPLTGMAETDALAALKAVGLRYNIAARPFDEKVPAGEVVAADAGVDSSGRLPRDSTVALMISQGPEPRTIPAGLVGQRVEAVSAQLSALSLAPASTEEYSDQPVGTVLSLNPAEGAVVPRDTPITIVVSKGPEPKAIPDLAGRTGLEAATALDQLGFGVTIDGNPNRPVLATDPPAGESHVPGTTVRVITRS